jgi:hypothetical protein
MATALTVAQMFDQVRRYQRINPPIDPPTNSGVPGQQPPDTPDPNNNTILQALNDGIYLINKIVRTGSIADASISVEGVSPVKRGALFVDISSVVPQTLVVSEIQNVWWYDSILQEVQQLTPLIYYQYNTVNKDFQQMAPSQNVEQFVVSGAQIGMLPAPVNPGTLWFTQVGGIPTTSAGQLVNTTDTISFLPVDLQQTVLYWAVVVLCMRRANDVEGAALLQNYLSMAQDGTEKIWTWKNGYDADGIKSVRAQLSMMSLLTLQANQAGSQPTPGS